MKNIIHVNALLYVAVLNFNIFSSCSSTKESLGISSDMIHSTGSASALIDLPSGVTHSTLPTKYTTMLQPFGMDLAAQSRILSAIDPRSPKNWIDEGWSRGYNRAFRVYMIRDGKKYFPPFDDMPTQIPRCYGSSKYGSTTVPKPAEEGATIRTSSIASFNDEITDMVRGDGTRKSLHWDQYDEMWDEETEAAGITSTSSIAPSKPIVTTSRPTQHTTPKPIVTTSRPTQRTTPKPIATTSRPTQRTTPKPIATTSRPTQRTTPKPIATTSRPTQRTTPKPIATTSRPTQRTTPKPIATTNRSTKPTTTTAPTSHPVIWWNPWTWHWG